MSPNSVKALFASATFLLPALSCAALETIPLSASQVRYLEDNVPVYSTEEPATAQNVIGHVVGYSCQRSARDEAPTYESGLVQLRFQAVRQNGNAVADAACSAPISGDDTKGCIQFVRCSGKAIKLEGRPAVAIPSAVATSFEASPQQSAQTSQPSNISSGDLPGRAEAWANFFSETIAKAKSGKVKPLIRASTSLSTRFYELFPEEINNPYIREYFAYLAVLAERVDAKKMTFAEAEYALAQKQREWMEAQAAAKERIEAQRLEAQRAIAKEAAQERAEREYYRRQAELSAQQAEAASRQSASSAMLNMGLGILQMNQNRAMTNYLNRPTVCSWMRTANGYTQVCQ